jgi:RNA polymerase sigma-70 factor (ECF subfamily)
LEGRFDLAAVVEQFESALLRYVGHLIGSGAEEIEDVVQETFLRLHRQVVQDGDASVQNLSSWLFRVAHNLAMDAGRRRRQRSQLQMKVTADPVVNPEETGRLPTPGEEMGHEEACRLAMTEVERLPEEQKTVVLLKIIQGFTLQQISDVTGMKIGTVNYRLTQGLRVLAERLQQAGVV